MRSQAVSEALSGVWQQAHAAALGGYLRSSQVIERSLELQLGAEQKARSRAEAEAAALGAHRVSAHPLTLWLDEGCNQVD